MKAEEDQSIYAIKATDELAFEALFRENYAPLCAFCSVKFRLSSDVAEDIVQAAFLRLWECRGNILSPMASKSYLYKIVTNSTFNLLKHDKIKTAVEKVLLQECSASILNKGFENLDFRKLETDFQNALSELPEQMRRIFILCKMEGLKYAEVANDLNISVKTVETQMSRALARIRERLSDYSFYVLLFCFALFH